MALIVHKYGGTSMGSTERIRNVAKRVAKWARAGHQMVVVPSAMSGETNRLLGLAKELAPSQSNRRLSAASSTCWPPPASRHPARCWPLRCRPKAWSSVSYAGWQVPIKTNSAYTKARIESIDDKRVRADLAAGKRGDRHRLSGRGRRGQHHHAGPRRQRHLGRGRGRRHEGHECLIYTDVDGVYTTDPRVVPEARRLHTVSFEEMLEMASMGSKVLQIRSVEFAGKYKVPLRVLSSFTPWDIPSTKKPSPAP
jgi:aspartate kinase